MVVINLAKEEDINSLMTGNELVVIHFYADWAEQCKNMNDVMDELSVQADLKDVKFAKVVAEDFPEVSLKYKIQAVPTFILLRGGNQVDRVDGANAADLTQKVRKQAGKILASTDTSKPAEEQDLNSRLKSLTNQAPVMLFMKGSPQEPKCGFSRQMITLLDSLNTSYKTFDILQDNTVREGLKTYSKWPTYPQLYVNGELVGGLDIAKELVATGELQDMLPKQLEDRIKSLINRSDIILFMKGTPEKPLCGFSEHTCDILREVRAKYDSYDVLKDPELREGLKKYSNWPTYPQLYVKGHLIGGDDIITELDARGELKKALHIY